MAKWPDDLLTLRLKTDDGWVEITYTRRTWNKKLAEATTKLERERAHPEGLKAAEPPPPALPGEMAPIPAFMQRRQEQTAPAPAAAPPDEAT